MRVDFEKRLIFCSVGHLVTEATFPRGGVERGDGFRRMWLGQEIHSRRAEERMAEDANYRPEVTVVHRVTSRGWDLTVSGRIDGLTVDAETRVASVEEVKSLHFDLELQALYRSDTLQRHLFQLMLYSWFLAQQEAYHGFEFRPQLALIDLVTGRLELLAAPYVEEDVAAAFHNAVERLVDSIETELALLGAKRAFADALPFPFPAMRPFQKEMVDAVEHAVRERETLLVSAPTGVGKTMAAIYPALRESLRAGKKLFFLTPKTLQQEMAVATLNVLNDGAFRSLRIRAKQKMCAHDEMICHEDFCPYAAKYAEKMQKNGLVSRIDSDFPYFDPDVVFELSKSEEVCPFEVSLELIEHTDVVVCDYNYIFDPWVGLKAYQQDDDFGDCVLIIDEAHNLVDRGRGYYSPELHEELFDAIESQLASRPGLWLDGWDDLVAELRAHFHALAATLDEARGESQNGAPRQALCDPDKRLFLNQRLGWERLIIRYVTWKIENRIAEEEDPLIDFYFKLVKFTNVLADGGEEFAHLVERTPAGVKLKIFCKDPARHLGKILDSAHAVIAISATLEPFDFYRQTLGFPRDRSAEISLPSPFPRENRKIVILPEVDTTYKERSQHYAGIAGAIGDMADAADGNFLALFPSYAFLQEVSARLPVSRKDIIVQRTDMTDWERRNLLDALRAPRGEGTLVLAVSGGMYAEGIDYQGDMLSGVFVVGPALPSVSFEQELLKQYYEEQYGRGFEYAYLIPGMTRVIQSAGRVIRSETDIGVIALLCRRFTQPMYNRYFPADWYQQSPRELVTKKPVDEIRAFFEAKRTPQLRIF